MWRIWETTVKISACCRSEDMRRGMVTHCGEGAPQSQHLSLPLPSFFWIRWSCGQSRQVNNGREGVETTLTQTIIMYSVGSK